MGEDLNCFTSLTLQGQTTDQDQRDQRDQQDPAGPAGPAIPGDVGEVKLQTHHIKVSHTSDSSFSFYVR